MLFSSSFRHCPALASARPPPAISAISAGEPLHRPSGSSEKSRPPPSLPPGIDHRRGHHLVAARDHPPPTLDRQAAAVDMGQIQYSEKYFDDTFEYRHVVLPPEVAKLLPKNRLLAENEWRALGVQQSRGWVHYAVHRPEPHIMLFRRPLNYQQQQDAAAAAAALMMPK
ncbi:cyclin-dependent kinases regulatory subunit 1 [Hordeum vulgare]|nr:cyclin-dependent kinases regulatory subunit 1 [Hordeum vulgare]